MEFGGMMQFTRERITVRNCHTQLMFQEAIRVFKSLSRIVWGTRNNLMKGAQNKKKVCCIIFDLS